MHIFLHIGSEKTGTTAIQERFARNRTHFRDRGLLYPDVKGFPNRAHRALCAYAVPTDALHHSHKLCGLRAVDEIAGFRSAWANCLAEVVKDNPAPRLLLSDETLSARLLDERGIETLHDLLAPLATKVSVVLYVRNPVQVAEGRYVMSILGGNTALFPDDLPDYQIQSLDQHAVAQRWASVFGREQVIVRHYGHPDGPKDVCADLVSVLGLDPGRDLPAVDAPRRANATPGRRVLGYLRLFNFAVPMYAPEGGDNPDRGPVVRALRSFEDPSRYRASRRAAEAIHERLRPAHEALIHEFLGGDPGNLLEPDLDGRPDEVDDLSIDTDDAVRIGVHLWRFQQARHSPAAPGAPDAPGSD